jgi:hypothetical protein
VGLLQRIATGVLLTFVVFTAGFAVGKEVGTRRVLDRVPKPVVDGAAGGGAQAAPLHRLAVWYYHSTKRCKKCNTIEAFAKEVLDERFPDRMASGEITWQVANMDDIWNQDAVRRYGLLRSSLVFVQMEDGVEEAYEVLDRVWDLTDDKEAFFAFLESEVEMVLDDGAASDDEPETQEEPT